ncbi:tail fiber assembly protein [Escherichia coli]
MSYTYSPSRNTFYPDEWRGNYEAAGTWPEDGISVTTEMRNEFVGKAPEGKCRVPGENGLPCWGDLPKLESSATSLQAQTAIELPLLMQKATLAIAPLQDAVDLGIATGEEVERLNSLKAYRVALSRTNPSAGDVLPSFPE